MDFKKMMPLLVVLVMIGALVGVDTASATTSRIAICNSNAEEVSSFNSTSNDECLDIYARLYVDGEWRVLRTMEFYVYSPDGVYLLYFQRLTNLFTGYAGIRIWNPELFSWKTGTYKVKVSFPGTGSEGYWHGWPEASTEVVIHHTNLKE